MLKTVFLRTWLIGSIVFACEKTAVKNKAFDFKKGVFEIPEGAGYSKTRILRKDSLQIEFYENRIDTLTIQWQGNFNYTLLMRHPKAELDKAPIRVKITRIKDNRYDFTAQIGHSNFEQKGTVYKIDD